MSAANASTLPALALLLHGLCGRATTVQQADTTTETGQHTRSILTETHLLLATASFDAEKTLPGLLRSSVAHAAGHLLYTTPNRPVTGLKPMGVALVSAIEDARVDLLMIQQYPGLKGWFLPWLQADRDASTPGFSALIARMSRALIDDDYRDDDYWVNKARAMFRACTQAHGLHDYAGFRRVASILANDLGQMRVRYNPQQFVVPTPYRDDNTFQWTDPRAPPAQSSHALTSSSGRPQALVGQTPQGEREPDAQPRVGQEMELGCARYPEWDYQREMHRLDWCTVLEKRPGWNAMTTHDQTRPDFASLPRVAVLRHRTLTRAQPIRRQYEGEQLDLNAAIETVIERRLGLAPDGRYFMRSGHRARTSSILILLDLSESANDSIAGPTQSVLELEKQAAIMLAHSTANSQDRIAIHGFSSNTRSAVRYVRYLDFGVELSAVSCSQIQNAQAMHSTRLGAALRHAATFFEDESSDQHAIIVVTDGAPSDIDIFDPAYLVADAAQAIKELQPGLRAYCVALDPQADSCVKSMFGAHNYRVVLHPRALPRQLADLTRRLGAH